jgi:PhnB protein
MLCLGDKSGVSATIIYLNKKPNRMMTLNPYVNFMGNTEEAFQFYRSVFGGEFIAVQRFRDTPEKDRVPADEQDKIMHMALPIGNSILMGTDALESMGHKLNIGNNMQLSVDTGSMEEGAELFTKLSEGGTVLVPFQKMFWGAHFGMLTDKFGIQWMVNFNEPQTV